MQNCPALVALVAFLRLSMVSILLFLIAEVESRLGGRKSFPSPRRSSTPRSIKGGDWLNLDRVIDVPAYQDVLAWDIVMGLAWKTGGGRVGSLLLCPPHCFACCNSSTSGACCDGRTWIACRWLTLMQLTTRESAATVCALR